MPATTTRREKRTVNNESQNAVAAFVSNLSNNSRAKNAALDSADYNSAAFDPHAALDFANDSSAKAPESLQMVLDEISCPKEKASVLKSVLDGVNEYERRHGVEVPPDVLACALNAAAGTTPDALKKFAILDSASSNHSDTLSLQSNRAVVGIYSTISEAIPIASYLPIDIGSNEGKLAILTHQAGSHSGMYEAGGGMDGIESGNTFISSSRIHAATNNAGAHTGQLTSVQTTRETCAAVGGDVVAVNLMRGRSKVRINGRVVAKEVGPTPGASTVSGSINIAGTTYQIGGTINTDTGEYALTSTPALNNAVPVVVEGFLDYERQPSLTPSVVVNVETFSLFADPWRVATSITRDSQTQIANELGLDPVSEALYSINYQYANERHYRTLNMAMGLALYGGNSLTFDFNWSGATGQGLQKSRADVLQDLQSPLNALSQQMAIDTMSYGIEVIYVEKYMMSMLMSLPSSMFQPSGVKARPGIYRLGRLFNQYEVYYTPKIVSGTSSSAQMLCIGKSNDVAKNPFVFGDAVPPTMITLGVGQDFKVGTGFYGRNFTEQNPHIPSSMGCALLNVTNMGL